MRTPLAMLIAAALAGCAKEAPPPPPPAPQVVEETIPDARFCAKPAEKTAFDVTAMKTRLMIAALSCGGTPQYNSFITKNRQGLVAQEKALALYFSRNYGRRGQVEQDDYITALANIQAQRRTRDTDAFCKDTTGIFDDVAKIKAPADLAAVASSKPIAQPMNVAVCP